jgi:hypothetical protein
VVTTIEELRQRVQLERRLIARLKTANIRRHCGGVSVRMKSPRASLLSHKWLLVALILLGVGFADGSVAQEFAESDYDKFVQKLYLAECKEFTGIVEAVSPDSEGAAIRFNATELTEYRKTREGEKPPHSDADGWALLALRKKNPPTVWYWTRKVSEVFSLRWNKADGPVPMFVGMTASIIVDRAGSLIDFSYRAFITQWRKRQDGFVEVVLGYKDHHENQNTPWRYLYVRPAKIGGFDWIHWTPKWGLLITTYSPGEAGGEAWEVEPLPFGRSGRRPLPLANTDEIQIVPGRDGWAVFPVPTLLVEKDGAKKDKMRQDFSDAIPRQQGMIPQPDHVAPIRPGW